MSGTSSPSTGSAETHQLQHLQSTVPILNRLVSSGQDGYRLTGLQYHSIPLQVRNLLANEPQLGICAQSFTVPDTQHPPKTITDVAAMRQARDEAKRYVRSAANRYLPRELESMRSDLADAEAAIFRCANINTNVGELQEMLVALHNVVETHEDVAAFYEVAQGYPFDAAETGIPTANGDPERHALMRSWLLATPEAQRMMTDLGESERSVVSLLTVTNEDRPLTTSEVALLELRQGSEAGEEGDGHSSEASDDEHYGFIPVIDDTGNAVGQ